MAQVVHYLPSQHKALSSNPSTENKQTNKQNKQGRGMNNKGKYCNLKKMLLRLYIHFIF
jgi:hypothetical protein